MPSDAERTPTRTSEAGDVGTELYLDLMKRVLTRVGFNDDLRPVKLGSRWQRRVWAGVEKVLARKQLVTLRTVPLRPGQREEGRDWPVHAETMIGLRRLDNIQYCVEQVLADEVPGDLLEAGVWRGGAAIFMRAVLAAHRDTSRTVWVADSFEGLPEARAEDVHDVAGNDYATQSYLRVDLDAVKANFTRYSLLDDQVRFLKGWFADTLPTAPIESLAVLRADGDMYRSTLDILEPLYPKVSPGGFVIIDDYGAVPACKAATDEYRDRMGITDPIQPIDHSGVFWRKSSA